MGKTTGNRPGFQFCRRGTVLRLFNDGREVLCLSIGAVDVSAAGKTSSTGRPKTVFIAVCGRDHTIGRHKDGTIERFKLFFLFPPGVAVVAGKMRILLESRIIVRWEHFGVRVHIYTGTGGLLQQHLEVPQIVSGNQNPGVLANTEVDRRDFRITISLPCRKHHTFRFPESGR